MYTNIMASKLIHVSEEAYNRLKKAKKKDESFSKAILRNFNPRKSSIMNVAGILSVKEADELEKGVNAFRKHFKFKSWQ